MPVKGVKVGDTFIEVTYDVDDTEALAHMRAFQAAASKMADIHGNVDLDTGPMQRAMAAASSRIHRDIDVDSNNWASTVVRNMGRAFQSIDARGMTNRIHQDIDRDSDGWGKRVAANLMRGLQSVTTRGMRINRDIDTDSDAWGHILSRNLTRGMDSFFSLMPGRLESLFSGKTGVVGFGIGAALLGAVGAALPAIGAMVSGVLFAAIGGGAVAAGIALVAKDPRVTAAAGRLKQMFNDEIFNGKGAEAFVQHVVPALGKVTEALQRWSPLINKMLQDSSKFIEPLTNGLIGFIDGFIGPLQRLMGSQFMQNIMNTLGNGLKTLGEALGAVFDKFLSNKDAMDGAVMGLNLAFNLLAAAIKTTADILVFLSATWKHWNTVGGDGMSFMDHVRDVFGHIGDAIKVVGNIIGSILVSSFRILKSVIEPMIPTLERIAEVIGGALVRAGQAVAGALHWFADFLSTHTGVAQGLAIALGSIAAAILVIKTVTLAVTIATRAWAVAQMILDAAQAASPMGLIVVAIAAIIAIIILVVTHLDFLKQKWDQVWGWIKEHAIAWWNNMWAFLSGWVQNIINWWNNSLNFIKELWNFYWGLVKQIADNIWNGIWTTIIGTLQAIWNFITGTLQAIANFFAGIWNAIYNTVAGWLTATWNFIVGLWSGAYAWIAGILQAIFNFFAGIWNAIYNTVVGWLQATWNFIVSVFNAIYGFFLAIWSAIQSVVGTAMSIIGNIIGGWLNLIHSVWNAAWQAIGSFLGAMWNAIVGVTNSAMQQVGHAIGAMLELIRSVWNAAWQAIGSFLGNMWHAIVGVTQSAMQQVGHAIGSMLELIRSVWNGAWQAIGSFLGNTWHAIVGVTGSAMDQVGHTIGSMLEKIKSVWEGMWNGAEKFFASFWDHIKNSAASGFNAVIDVVNGGIDLINGILGKVGVDFRIPKIDHVGGGHAAGGHITGPGTDTSDSIPAWLSNDEYVVKSSSARRIGYDALDHINRTGRLPAVQGINHHHYAGGGAVGRYGWPAFASGGHNKIVWKGANGDNEGLMEQHRNHVHVAMNVQPSHNTQYNESILKIAQESHLPLNPGSGFRAGSTGSGGGLDHHSEGRATDFMGYNQDDLAMFFAKRAETIELIHRSNKGDYGIFGGGKGGGILSFLNKWLRKGAAWIIDHMIKPETDKIANSMPKNLPGQFIAGTIHKWEEGIKKKIQDTIDMAVDTGNNGFSGNAGQWSTVAAEALKMLGMPASWLSGVLTIIGRESGGNPNIVNRTDSNAAKGTPSIGLMQVIQPTFDRYHVAGHDSITDPLSNILAALRYIQATYGSVPAVAGRPGGYDNGGWMQPGWNFNGTGEPEMALNKAQGLALEHRIRGHGADGIAIAELHIHVGGSVSAAEAKKIAKTVRDELVKLKTRNGGRSGL